MLNELTLNYVGVPCPWDLDNPNVDNLFKGLVVSRFDKLGLLQLLSVSLLMHV